MSTDSASTSAGAIGPQLTITRSSYWRIMYTNIVGLGFGENECRLTIGFDQDLSKPGTNVLEESVVVMPHKAAKMLMFTLNAVIANWEAVNGPIPLQADRIEEIERQIKLQASKGPAPKPG